MTDSGSLGILTEIMTFPTVPYLTRDIATETMLSEILELRKKSRGYNKLQYPTDTYRFYFLLIWNHQ